MHAQLGNLMRTSAKGRSRRSRRSLQSVEQLEIRILPTTINLRGTYVADPLTSAVADINSDAWTELLGAVNDQSGNLTAQNLSAIGLGDLFANGRANRDVSVAD